MVVQREVFEEGQCPRWSGDKCSCGRRQTRGPPTGRRVRVRGPASILPPAYRVPRMSWTQEDAERVLYDHARPVRQLLGSNLTLPLSQQTGGVPRRARPELPVVIQHLSDQLSAGRRRRPIGARRAECAAPHNLAPPIRGGETTWRYSTGCYCMRSFRRDGMWPPGQPGRSPMD